MSKRFSRVRGGGLRVRLSEPERDLLRSLPEELRTLYESADPTDHAADDPVRARLFPRAYLDPTAEEAEREWRELVVPELVRERLAALAAVAATLDDAAPTKRGDVEAVLDDEAAAAWLGVLNDARLALGTRLGVTEELDHEDLAPEDPRAPAFAAYGWLTYLQGELVDTLLGDLPG